MCVYIYMYANTHMYGKVLFCHSNLKEIHPCDIIAASEIMLH